MAGEWMFSGNQSAQYSVCNCTSKRQVMLNWVSMRGNDDEINIRDTRCLRTNSMGKWKAPGVANRSMDYVLLKCVFRSTLDKLLVTRVADWVTGNRSVLSVCLNQQLPMVQINILHFHYIHDNRIQRTLTY